MPPITGIELITEERHKQYAKGHTVQTDIAHNGNHEFISAIMMLAGSIGFKRNNINMPIDAFNDLRPETWDAALCLKYVNQSEIEQLKKIGAFAAAEIDRLQNL